MSKMGLTIGICQALQEVWAEYPMWVKERGRIIFRDGIPQLNVSSRTCAHFDAESGICKVTCKVRNNVRTPDEGHRDKQFTLLTKFVKYNDWWESRAEEEHELVDFSMVGMEEQLTIDNNISLFLSSKGRGKSSAGEAGTAWSYIQSMLDQGCVKVFHKWPVRNKMGDVIDRKMKFFFCPLHSGYEEVRSRILQGGTDLEIAHDIIHYFIKPDYRLKEPWNDDFSWEQYKQSSGMVYLRVKELMNDKFRPLPEEKARKIAWAQFHSAHPRFQSLKANIEGVKLNDAVLKPIKRDNYLTLRRMGLEVDKSEALDVYRASFRNVPVANGQVHEYIGPQCPITKSAPNDHYAVKIVRHVAVTDQFKEIGPENTEAVVQLADGSYELASEFNSWELGFRKAALGCDCENCKQEDVWFMRLDSKGRKYFTYKVEDILYLTEQKASELSALQEASKSKSPMSSLEMEDYDAARRCLAYDIDELPDWKDVRELVDAEVDEEEDVSLVDDYSVLSGGVMPLESNNHLLNEVETSDNLDLYIGAIKKSGPVKVSTHTKEELDKMSTDYIMARVRVILKEGAELQEEILAREAHHIKAKVEINKPRLKPEDERLEAIQKLDKKIAQWKAEYKAYKASLYDENGDKINRFHTATNPPVIPDGWSIDTLRRFRPYDYMKLVASGFKPAK